MTPGLTFPEYARRCAWLGWEPARQHDLTPPQRLEALPAWLGPELTVTPAARTKLSAWVHQTPRDTWDVTPDPADMLVRLQAVGDEAVPHVVARLLCRLPAPVRDYVLRRVTLLSVGAWIAGFCGPRVDFGDRPWLVTLGADRDVDRLERLAVHEFGHAWLLDEPGPDVTLRTAFACATIQHTPIDQVPADLQETIRTHRALFQRDEQQAIALARAWGFAQVDEP